MTCIVVNDASCLIDLKKGELLHVLLRLPYRFIVPLPIREEELLDFTAQEWRMLEDGGLATYDLPGEEVARVFALKGSGQNMGVMRRVFCLRRSADHRELRPL
ncbi:hypothetical protein SAMN06297129_3913 [Pseudooceanicola antarcticus]|uniref:Uncharacterized protein n=1 Tax=Pseudooceanicola antarcticus TaxID=1247613 RepID=A0A285JIQ8_9RHOB|nr:hypothetical protein [Pseudooceanicola antarcticus]SNY60164.1 hypothetical protein SAMN06297129_3913 [Pseudooceanicola antarcticus]